MKYLAAEVPRGSQSAIMYNTVLSSAQHHRKPDVAAKALQMMADNGVARDAQTWVHIFRALVSLLLSSVNSFCLPACGWPPPVVQEMFDIATTVSFIL